VFLEFKKRLVIRIVTLVAMVQEKHAFLFCPTLASGQNSNCAAQGATRENTVGNNGEKGLEHWESLSRKYWIRSKKYEKRQFG
jgi:hypothetical protein